MKLYIYIYIEREREREEEELEEIMLFYQFYKKNCLANYVNTSCRPKKQQLYLPSVMCDSTQSAG